MQKLRANELAYVSETVLRNLLQNRISTIVEFLQEDITTLAAITKLNLPQILAVRNEIFAKYSAPVISGPDLLEKSWFKSRFQSSGIEKKVPANLNTQIKLDELLGGGIPRGQITEFCGLSGSGKTQLCLQFAIHCPVNTGTVLYLDTKGDFSAVRVQKVLDASGITRKEMANFMCKINVVRVWTMEEAIELFQNIKQKTIKLENLAMIIIDSLPCLMLQFLGDENKIGLRLLNVFVNYIRYLSKELGICVICVNIQTRWVDQDIVDLEDDGEQSTISKETFTEKRNRCLGRYWQNIPYLVLQLDKSAECRTTDSGSQFVVSVMKSNVTKIISKQCMLHINPLGVT